MARRAGTIYEVIPNEKYVIQVESGTTAEGKRRIVKRTIYGTMAEADAERARIALELGRSDVIGDSMTLSTYYRCVFRTGKSTRGTSRSKNTLMWYDGAMKHILDKLGDKPVRSITHEEMARVIQSAGSPANAKTALRAVMLCAYDDGLLENEPFRKRIPTHREHKIQLEPWSFAEAMRALEIIDRQDLMAICVLGLSGLRMEECLGVRPCDIADMTTRDYATGEVIETMAVTVARTYTDRGGWTEATKNPQSRRIVPIFFFGRQVLRDCINDLRLDEPSWAQSRLVPIRGDALYRKWQRMCLRCSLRIIPPSMLRHTSDTMALSAGVDPQLNAKMHGRTDPGTAYRHYYRPGLALQEGASRQVGSVLEHVGSNEEVKVNMANARAHKRNNSR